MASSLKGNMLIAQSGGPSMVINQSLIGALKETKKRTEIQNIYGALYGIKGILNEDFIDLRKESDKTLDEVANTPCSALGSVRKKPTEEECEKLFSIIEKYNIRYFFYIGGNDSAETAYIINENAKRINYEFTCFHIPKTIDNDLKENDHTPGFGSAAKFVAYAIMGDNLDNRSLPGVKIDVIMGRHAGFLTAASALAHLYPDDGPHLIYLPERAFSIESFTKDIENVYKKLGRCLVAVSEGITDEEGIPIISKFTKEVDAHGNVQLSGTGALGDLLAEEVRIKTGISRVRADTFGYLQRSFPGLVSKVDAKEAWMVGEIAVKYAVDRRGAGSIAIKRKEGKSYQIYYECVPLQNVAKETRCMSDEFINEAGNGVTEAFIEYVKPIVGKLPKVGRFEGTLFPRVK